MTLSEQITELVEDGMPHKDATAIALSVERARKEATASREFRRMMELEMAWKGSGLER